MLASVAQSRAEIMVRAVRDHLADALSTLPGLLADPDPVALHFYMANLSNLRREQFPALVSAYEIWSVTGDLAPLQAAATQAVDHWQSLAEELLELYYQRPSDCQHVLVRCIEHHGM